MSEVGVFTDERSTFLGESHRFELSGHHPTVWFQKCSSVGVLDIFCIYVRLEPLRHIQLRGGDGRETIVLARSGVVVNGVQVEVLRRGIWTGNHGGSRSRLVHWSLRPAGKGPVSAGYGRNRQLH